MVEIKDTPAAAPALKRIPGIYQKSLSFVGLDPTIWVLFGFLGILDFSALTVLFLSPSEPLLWILGPVIRTFWGERFLHYPQNFLLLPKLFSHAHFLISTLFGVVITGIIIKKIEALSRGRRLHTPAALRFVFQRYFSLLFVWLVSYAAFVLISKKVFPLLPMTMPVQTAVGFSTALLIQAFFAFFFPVILVAGRGFFSDLVTSLRLTLRHFFLLVALLTLPMLVVLVVSFFKVLAPVYVRFYPEAVLMVLALGIVVTLAVDLFVTLSTTLCFLEVNHAEKA